jgi:predicted DsbA family dithiol-disulfide isomerase
MIGSNLRSEGQTDKPALHIEIFSDVVCPWCYIGKRRIETALDAVQDRYESRVIWRPFELNLGMPPSGLERKAYLQRKFGSMEALQQLEARVTAVGAADGISFAFDRIQRTPNTFDAHRLIWHAQREELQDETVEALFRRYFIEGADVGNKHVLIEIARVAGLNAEQVERDLSGDEGAAPVRKEEERGRNMGITGVPHFLINGAYAISGAQEPKTLVSAFDLVTRQTPIH